MLLNHIKTARLTKLNYTQIDEDADYKLCFPEKYVNLLDYSISFYTTVCHKMPMQPIITLHRKNKEIGYFRHFVIYCFRHGYYFFLREMQNLRFMVLLYSRYKHPDQHTVKRLQCVDALPTAFARGISTSLLYRRSICLGENHSRTIYLLAIPWHKKNIAGLCRACGIFEPVVYIMLYLVYFVKFHYFLKLAL